jgi:hypothetical protein
MEIVISIVLLGILSVAGTNLIKGSFYTTQLISNGHMGHSMAQYAMERMIHDIREISYDTTAQTLGISTASATQLTFTKSEINGTTTAISYSHTGSNLTMTVAGVTATLANNITSFSFSYLDVNDGTPASPQNVCTVRITLKAEPAQAQAIELTTLVRLRNISKCKP